MSKTAKQLAHITRLGYLYCSDCVERGVARKARYDDTVQSVLTVGSQGRDTTCALCDRPAEAFPETQYEASDFWVEGFACKVF